MSIITWVVGTILLLCVIAGVLGLYIFLTIVISIVLGSNVDPDDNGLLKNAEEREKWRQQKLKKLNEMFPHHDQDD